MAKAKADCGERGAGAAEQTVRLLLEKSEERYRLLFEGSLAGVCHTTLDGEIRECNRAFCRMLGYDSPSELRRIRIYQLHKDPGRRDRMKALLLERSSAVNAELEMVRKNGTPITVMVNLALLRDPRGAPAGIEGTCIDISETRRLQRELLQAQKMEAIGQLAGGVAHDFNNLLTVISNQTELLRVSLREPRQRRCAEQVLKTTQRAVELTRQLLAFSRRRALAPQVLDLNAVVREVGKILPRLIGEHIEVNLVLSSDLGKTRANPTQIEQVILNLAVNARDAMPSGGRLTLETATVELDSPYCARHGTMGPGRYILLAVSDTGTGIEPAVLPHIFEPFFTTKEHGKGTGLGLSTAYGIVRQSGGHMLVHSEMGRGASFKIYLPWVAQKTNESPCTVAAPAADTRRAETILLVEDEASLREAAAEFLNARGYRVLQAANGQHGMELARAYEGSIDLLLTDAILPGAISGPDLARRLLEIRPDLRVLYMSGYTEATILQYGLIDAAAQFLQKPFSFYTLGNRLREILGMRPRRRRAGRQAAAGHTPSHANAACRGNRVSSPS